MKQLGVIALFILLVSACELERTADTRFQLLDASETGIDFNNEIVETDSFNILRNEYMYNGGGVGIGDFNNDGLQDVLLTGNKVSTRLYQNLGDLRFKDITSQLNGLSQEQWISGVSVVDINSDGLLDIYLTSTTNEDPQLRRNQLWVNQGVEGDTPSFREAAQEYGIADTGYSVNAAFFDYDLDGDLDLYVLNNTVNKDVPTNYRPKLTDGSSLNNDSFYRNNGDGTFKNITIEAGIVIEGFGLGLAVSDINKDGYPDVYVSNDYISNDLMYINQRDGTFENEIESHISYQSKFSMGNDVNDINNDGNPDIMTLDMMPQEYFRKKQTINGNSYFAYINDEKYDYEHQYVRNMVQVHNGFIGEEMVPFSEVGQFTSMFDTEWSWSPLFADYDNDGDKDVIVTNGFPRDLTDKDFTNYKAQMYNYLATDEMVLSRVPEVKVSNFVYENVGNLQYEDATASWGMDIPSYSNGASFVDLDNDGDLDYIVNNINDQAFVYKNNTMETEPDKKYLRLKLFGEGQNKMGIGAKIELWQNGKIIYHENFLTRGYISSVEPVIHFGLGMGNVDSLFVKWPATKRINIFYDVKPNAILEIDESVAIADTRVSKAVPSYLFGKAEMLSEYVHHQRDFIDFFQYQNIMPHKFSQVGPCITKGDLDGDGVDDLLIGASDSVATTAYRGTADGFEKISLPGLTSKKMAVEADLVIVDIDNDGDNDVIALSGGYANQNMDEYSHYLYRNESGSFEWERLDMPGFVASVVRPFDYDQDGDMDLFIGARVKKFKYPESESSYILVNENGSFTRKDELTFDLGMVTDAVWTDYDGDGWKDLMITREWDTPTILKNDEGKSLVETQEELLSQKYGLWYSVTAADLDGDGDDDYVLGNLGDNHRFNISAEYPMRLYGIDIDENSTLDPITTAYWKDSMGVMQEYPVNYWDELASQSPVFRKRYQSYTEFSMGLASDFLPAEVLDGSYAKMVNTTSSGILWNNEGSLEWEDLPLEVQLSPLKKVVARDLDGDGSMDLVLAGNDYSYDVSTGYYDANKGLIMFGEGDRKFRLAKSSETGLLLTGQIEGLLYFEDKETLVASVNRKGIKVIRKN